MVPQKTPTITLPASVFPWTLKGIERALQRHGENKPAGQFNNVLPDPLSWVITEKESLKAEGVQSTGKCRESHWQDDTFLKSSSGHTILIWVKIDRRYGGSWRTARAYVDTGWLFSQLVFCIVTHGDIQYSNNTALSSWFLQSTSKMNRNLCSGVAAKLLRSLTGGFQFRVIT